MKIGFYILSVLLDGVENGWLVLLDKKSNTSESYNFVGRDYFISLSMPKNRSLTYEVVYVEVN